jgi:hypothetical protein
MNVIDEPERMVKEGVMAYFISLLSLFWNKKFWQGPHRKRHVPQFFHCCEYIRYRGNVFTEPLPNSDRGIHIQTHGLLGYAVETELGTMILYIPNFVKTGSGIKKLIGGIYRQTAWRSHKLTLGKYAKKETRLTRSPCCLSVCLSEYPFVSAHRPVPPPIIFVNRIMR